MYLLYVLDGKKLGMQSSLYSE